MALMKIDIGTEMGKGWQLFQQNMGLLVLSGLVVIGLSLATFGILSGPMIAGLLLIVRRLIRKDPIVPQVGDLFKGFDFFVPSLILMVMGIAAGFVLSLLPVIGHVLGLLMAQLLSMVVGAVIIWAMMFVAYQELDAIAALKKVFGHLQKGEFAMPLLFAFLASIVSGLGLVACFVGIFFTFPLGYCMAGACHETLFGTAGGETTVEAEVVEIPPPPGL